jgi:hypothetical protein
MRALKRSPSEFGRLVKAPASSLDFEALASEGYVRTLHEDGDQSLWICLWVEKPYNLLEEYGKARKRRHIDVTAHGLFWSLTEGSLLEAVTLWRRFGHLDSRLSFRSNVGRRGGGLSA